MHSSATEHSYQRTINIYDWYFDLNLQSWQNAAERLLGLELNLKLKTWQVRLFSVNFVLTVATSRQLNKSTNDREAFLRAWCQQ